MANTNKPFVGDVGTVITVNTREDISTATKVSLMVQKPDGSEDEWIGTIYNERYIRYTIADGDFNVAGTYRLQAYVEMPGWKGRGVTTEFDVYDYFES